MPLVTVDNHRPTKGNEKPLHPLTCMPTLGCPVYAYLGGVEDYPTTMPTRSYIYARALAPSMPSVTMGIRPYAHCHCDYLRVKSVSGA